MCPPRRALLDLEGAIMEKVDPGMEKVVLATTEIMISHERTWTTKSRSRADYAPPFETDETRDARDKHGPDVTFDEYGRANGILRTFTFQSWTQTGTVTRYKLEKKT